MKFVKAFFIALVKLVGIIVVGGLLVMGVKWAFTHSPILTFSLVAGVLFLIFVYDTLQDIEFKELMALEVKRNKKGK